jgi:signal transduction histidine kinase/ligand-binding sensor domain-containing protein
MQEKGTNLRRISVFKYLVWLLFLWANNAIAQDEFRFKHLGSEEGFPQSTVNSICEDADGFMWFGTQDGLVKYNGYTFTAYRPQPGKPGTISHGYINAVKEDKSGRYLWIGTRGGLSRYEKATGLFENYNPDKANVSPVVGICIQNNGKIWVVSGTGLFAFYPDEWANRNKKGFGVIPQLADNKILTAGITNLNILSENTLIITAHKQLWVKDENDHFYCIGNYIQQKSPDNPNIIPLTTSCLHNKVYLINDNQPVSDTFFINRKINLANLSEANAAFTRASCAEQDHKGNIWIGSIDGLRYIQAGNKKPEPVLLTHNAAVRYSLSSDIIVCIYEDRSGLIWVGTSYGGINIYNPQTSAFKHLNDDKTKKWHLNNKYIFGLAEDGHNNIWVGSMNGLNCIKTDSGLSPDYFQNIYALDLYLNKPGNLNSLSENKTGKLFYAGHDSLFISTVGGGVNILDTRKGLFKAYKADKENPALKTNYTQGIFRDNKKQIWISTSHGPVVWNSNKKTLEIPDLRWPPVPEAVNVVMAIFEDSKGKFWFEQSTGLLQYDPATMQSHYFTHDDKDKNSLSANTIGVVYEDHAHRTWVGTLGGGLNLYNPKNNIFKAYTENDGLANNHIYGILEDKAGNLWMSTNKGIAMFNPETIQFRNYGPSDGLGFSEFAQHSYCKAHNGWMFFGGEDGIICFNPEEVNKPVKESSVKLLDLKINYESVGESLNGAPLSHLEQLDLNYRQKVISFEFGTLNYINPEKCKYAYKLEGFDDAWHYTDAHQRFATYTNLPYGHYNFIVKTTDVYGNWVSNPLSIRLRTIPPFWYTWWFICLLALASLAIIIYIVSFFSRLRLQRRLQKLELANSLQSERERISRELHDNVGSQLTYIISKLETTRQKTAADSEKDIDGSLENIGSFARNTMQQLRESIWAMNKDSFTLSEFEMKLRDYIGKYLDPEAGVAWQITIENKNEAKLSPALVVNLFRIIQEAVNNTIKHAHATEINIRISSAPKSLSVSIADNGIGIPVSDNSVATGHYGFQNMKKRAAEMKGDITIQSNEGQGTQIILTIPL